MVKDNMTFAGEFLKISLEQKVRFKKIVKDIEEIVEDYPLNGRVDVSYTNFECVRIDVYSECPMGLLKELDTYFGLEGVVFPRELKVMIEYSL